MFIEYVSVSISEGAQTKDRSSSHTTDFFGPSRRRTLHNPHPRKCLIEIFGKNAIYSPSSDSHPEIAYGSSKGPTMISLQKPGVVAPGPIIVTQCGDYKHRDERFELASSSGTSFARPPLPVSPPLYASASRTDASHLSRKPQQIK